MNRLLRLNLLVACFVSTAFGDISLVVGYCPTAFTNAGAIVSVDSATGKHTIKHKFEWPQSDVFGCLFNNDPVPAQVQSHNVYLDFADAFGVLLVVDTDAGKVVQRVKPTDPFFVGFTNYFEAAGSNASTGGRATLKGLTPTVTQSGFCSDGCFGFGEMHTASGQYRKLANIPFKAISGGGSFFDAERHHMWVQGSYDLRGVGHTCAPDGTAQCLLQIDTETGELVDAKGPNSWEVYHYHSRRLPATQNDALAQPTASSPLEALAAAGGGSPTNSSTVKVWAHGFKETCKGYDYAFGTLDLATAAFEKGTVSCLAHNTTVQMDEWISSFNPDATLFATASGDTEGQSAQIIVANVSTGKVVVNSKLPGLGIELGAFQRLFSVWALDWLA